MRPYLLETDQIYCYSQDGTQIRCNNTGQDASIPKKIIKKPISRFQIRNSVVEDKLTGIIWSRDANPMEYPLTWQEAQAYLKDMRKQEVHGYDNWQLPRRALLFSVISHQQTNPVLPVEHPFQSIFPGYYWTAETTCRLPDQAWYIHMGGGRVHKGMKHGAYMVWPVAVGNTGRELQTDSITDRFKRSDDCIHDTQTGLTWCENADIIGKPLTWQAAIEAVEEVNLAAMGGWKDWRLPNIRELESLIDLKHHSPALPDGHPFTNVNDAYWSSTTSVYEPRFAWTLYTQDGIVGVGFKAKSDFYLWPVRDTFLSSDLA